MRQDPQAEAAKAMRQMTLQLERATQRQSESTGGIQMFWEQVVGFA
jgi:flagellar biosynthesis protein FlhG